MTLWTDSFDPKQAPTSHLLHVYDVGPSVPREDLVMTTGVETLLTPLSKLTREDQQRIERI